MTEKKIKVILSTHGGRLKDQAKIALVENALQTTDLDYQLALTEYSKHAIELACQAALDGWPIVVAAGGDGTISEVVNGLMQAAGEDIPSTLAILPLGTGNDLADMLKVPRDITTACRHIAVGNTRLLDVGMVNGHYFINNSAVGLEPVVVIEHERIRYVSGNIRYIVAALKALVQAKPWNMRIDWDTGVYDGPVILVSVGNGPRTGGGFYMTPHAEFDDGLFDFVYAVGMSRWQLLMLLPKTFSGKHIHHPLVTYLKTKSLSITATPVIPVHADGELIDEAAVEVKYHIIPQKLPVIV